MSLARILWLTWRGAWLEAWSNRRGFWTQALAMILNDLVWIAFWILFFRRVGRLNGWEIDQVLVLFSVLTTSAGIIMGLLHNTRRIGYLVSDGALDAALVLPTPTLPYLMCRKVEATNAGDVLFGLMLFAFFCEPTPTRTVIFVFAVACSVLVSAGFMISVGALSFATGRSDAADLGFQALFLFSAYPIDIFSGAVKLFLYVVIPAGFVTAVPVRLIEDFEPLWALAALGFGIASITTGWMAFTIGLRRYTSGAVWSQA